jgi:hypothetical protein
MLGPIRHQTEVMRDQQQRHPQVPLHPVEQIQDLRLNRHVQAGGRLVGDQDRRPRSDSRSDQDALALAAGELVRVAFKERGVEPDLSESVQGSFAGALLAMVHDDALHHLLADGQDRVQCRRQ